MTTIRNAQQPRPAGKDSERTMRHDQTGEFDYGIEGGQTQDHGPDRTDGTSPDGEKEKAPGDPDSKKST